ncbi:MAG: type I-U CRISPR-associated protein Csb2, partial [Planctomycetota bacterium]
MNTVLCFTLRFLDPVPQFHGRGDDGDPEWPPSPLRLFQSLVSAAAQRWRDDEFRNNAQPALQWLERIQPTLVTPRVASESFGYRMYVPNNSGDLMTAAWARGDTDTSMAKFRVEKDVRPLNLQGEAIRCLFPLSDGACPHFAVLQAAARSVTHLGWGIEMLAGNAEIHTNEHAAALPGEVWRWTTAHTGTGLR